MHCKKKRPSGEREGNTALVDVLVRRTTGAASPFRCGEIPQPPARQALSLHRMRLLPPTGGEQEAGAAADSFTYERTCAAARGRTAHERVSLLMHSLRGCRGGAEECARSEAIPSTGPIFPSARDARACGCTRGTAPVAAFTSPRHVQQPHRGGGRGRWRRHPVCCGCRPRTRAFRAAGAVTESLGRGGHARGRTFMYGPRNGAACLRGCGRQRRRPDFAPRCACSARCPGMRCNWGALRRMACAGSL